MIARWGLLLFLMASLALSVVAFVAIASARTMPEPTPGELFDTLTGDQQDAISAVCHRSFEAHLAGDTKWLQRHFSRAPKTPPTMQLLVVKLCVTYAKGVQHGIDKARALTR